MSAFHVAAGTWRTCAAALALLAGLFMAAHANAAATWTAQKAKSGDFPPRIVAENRSAAPSRIPAMLTASARGCSGIARAWYSEPTSRYRHGALGDTIEGGALTARLAGGRTTVLKLPESEVFEDIAPRIVDLDGDGKCEIITILSSLGAGGSIVVFGLEGTKLVRKATGARQNRPHRWLNIAGIARYAASHGSPQIAYVATPHIGGTLGLLRYSGGRLTLLGSASGFSNHAFGSQELRLAASADVDGDGRLELALPSTDRRALRIMDFGGGNPREIARIELAGVIDKAIAVRGAGADTAFVVGLEDGSAWRIAR